MRKKAIITYVDENIYEKLNELAIRKGASISQVVREIILHELNGDRNGEN
ncbi:ribbon-helix-helix domain-containing protein (plasmid) [Sulfolobus tengchongensis]|uniref:Ribbon-helix-helix domain-containing protein n=1 Tax=Sulfolobus tengchongensis TaxID=207809 RepID=A0AAX4L1K3_9CREN